MNSSLGILRYKFLTSLHWNKTDGQRNGYIWESYAKMQFPFSIKSGQVRMSSAHWAWKDAMMVRGCWTVSMPNYPGHFFSQDRGKLSRFTDNLVRTKLNFSQLWEFSHDLNQNWIRPGRYINLSYRNVKTWNYVKRREFVSPQLISIINRLISAF